MASILEQETFSTLSRIVKMYEAAQKDEEKLYHVMNMIGVLRPLEAFLHSKMDISRGGDGTGRIDVPPGQHKVEVELPAGASIHVKKE